MNTPTLSPEAVSYVNRSFRNVADRDYIAARICYRNGLDLQFLWNALQCMEKYLKAILIYNGVSSHRLGHKVHDALRRVQAIKSLSVAVPQDVEDFCKYLQNQGENRYLEYSYWVRGDRFTLLDKTVWHVRRYCQYLDGTFIGSSKRVRPYRVAAIQNSEARSPHKFSLSGGLLEKLLSNRPPAPERFSEAQAAALVWKNLYFGRRARTQVTYPNRTSSTNVQMSQALFSELEPFVQFSASVKNHFQSAKQGSKNKQERKKM